MLTGTNRILIYTGPGDSADTIDLSKNNARHAQTRTIGTLDFNTLPVTISGNTATIYPHGGAPGYGQDCNVVIEAGVFAGITNETSWKFHTRAASPAADAARVTVAADGTGDFCTVQGAVDFVPVSNTVPRTIYIRNGTYEEIVYVLGKHALTFLGEDRK
ncbi:MAG: pectinesterase family protein, partial [Bryobacteraceae bacterium]